jgi:formate/nitrite transporter FocA (FNT family)
MKRADNIPGVLCKSILAGIMIAIGGTVFLSCESKVVGAVLFSIGLFFIVVFGFNLFTGKIAYLIDNGWRYLVDLSVILLGNLIGTLSVGLLIRLTRLSGAVEKAVSVCDVKLSDSLPSIFILAFFCGILMFLAVDGYKTIDNPLGKYLAVFLGVSVFILSGFEHCVANMFYFSVAAVWSAKSVLYMLAMILGNSFGALFFNFMKRRFVVAAAPVRTKEPSHR